jgi:hypothetical protein
MRSGQSLYRLSDQYVAFWYRFVDPLRQLLALERIDSALAAIQSSFDQYVAESVFEDICRQFLWRALAHDQLPAKLAFDAVGSWWVACDDLQDQIDVVARREVHAVAVGECIWSVQPVDQHTLQGLSAALRKATPDLHPVDRPWRFLFSRSGFSDELVAMAKDPEERVILIAPGDLYA